jgi:hypothetical protein
MVLYPRRQKSSVLPVVSCGCDTHHKMRLLGFETRVLKGVFDHKRREGKGI